ncbi:MAG: glycosyl transferase, family [Deltaproteobacteria bacterium]|nr:glycosyl transferase, family [Deltaproteobacteria bacterium]
MPKVSVIITTFNRRHFLQDAFQSVAAQDYKDREIIIVDDGSTDDTCDHASLFPARYIGKKNGGISSARNAGLNAAQGEYIAFLDVDDLWKKRKLATQLEVMEETGVLLSYTDEIWLRNGKRLNQKLRHRKYSGMIFEHCLPLCIISPSSAVIHRSVFDNVGIFDESLPVCEDYDMWLRITSRYPVLFIEKPLIIKQGGHTDQLSRAYDGMDRFRIASIAQILDSGKLDPDCAAKAVRELAEKCRIYAGGALKRGRKDEADHYFNLAASYTHVQSA